MIKKRTVLSIFLIFHLLMMQGQMDLKLLCSNQTKALDVKLDVLSNIYLINANGMTKQNLCDKISSNYSFVFNGDYIIVDVNSPFKILVYFSSNNTIEYLNNQLSIIGNSIKVDDYSNGITTLACSSYDNGLWFYSSSENVVIRYNSELKKTHQSAPIDEIFQQKLYPTQFFEKQEKLFLGIPNYGVLIFDKYGSYLKRIPILFQQQFNVIGTKYYYTTENSLKAYDSKTFEEIEILREDSRIISFDINSKYIVLVTQNGLFKLYQIPSK